MNSKSILLNLPIIIFFVVSANSQEKFAPIGAKWNYNNWIDYTQQHLLADYYVIESIGDTIIGQDTLRIVGTQLIKQDSARIYYYENGEYHLIYDFDVEIGDIVVFDMKACEGSDEIISVEYEIEEIDSIEVDGIALKRVKAFSSYNWDDYVYIERIGSVERFIEDLVNCFWIPEFIPDWLRCYKDSEIDYKSDYFSTFGERDCSVRFGTNSIEEKGDEAIKIYPNPSKNSIFIELEAGNYMLEIYDMKGRLVKREELNGLSKEIDISTIWSGIYMIRIQNREDNRILTKKMIKE